jgi:hypothetical protein
MQRGDYHSVCDVSLQLVEIIKIAFGGRYGPRLSRKVEGTKFFFKRKKIGV